MIRRFNVPTRNAREYLLEFFNEETRHLLTAQNKPKTHKPRFPEVLCKFHAVNKCMRGELCNFSHDESRFKCPEKQSNGKCAREECKYQHDFEPSHQQHPRDSAPTALPAEDELKRRKPFFSPFS